MADMWARSRLTASPPLRPATRASSDVNSWAVPLACAARPPLLAISRCLDGSIDAKPRLLVEAMLSPLSVLRELRCTARKALLAGFMNCASRVRQETTFLGDWPAWRWRRERDSNPR